MLKLQLVPTLLAAATLGLPAWQASTQTTPGALKRSPIVTAIDAPAGTEALAVQWVSVAVPDVGFMVAAVARPAGAGPFPVVVLLHGTHGFARQYVQWAQDLARGGFLAVAGCWFSGGSGAGSTAVTSADSVSGDTAPEARRVPRSGAVYRRPGANGPRAAQCTPRSAGARRTLTRRRRGLAIRTGDRRRAGRSSSFYGPRLSAGDPRRGVQCADSHLAWHR